MQISRRGFVATAAALAGIPQSSFAAKTDSPAIRLGVATYSFRKFSRPEAIKMTQQLGVKNVDVKEFHLPYKDSPEQLKQGRKEFEDAGLKIVAGGNIDMKGDEAQLRKMFDYAKTCGMPVMVIAPAKDNMPQIEKLVKQYDIKVAIHNHGPEDKNYPTLESALDVIGNMDPRVGLCLDLGHEARTGSDVVQAVVHGGARLFEVHIKDLTSFTDKNSQVPVGDGIMPVPAIFAQLQKINFGGTVSLEYEVHPEDPMPGMTKSFVYMRKVVSGMKA